MGQDERILLSVAFVGLVALLLAKFKDSIPMLSPDVGRAVNVRNFNMINWSAVTAPASVLPQASSGENGVSTMAPGAPWNDCGCY